MAKILDVAVLNSFQAAGADVEVVKGKLQLDAAASDAVTPIYHKDIISWTNTPYAAGTAAVLKFQYSGVTFGTPGVQYSVVTSLGGINKSYSVVSAAGFASAEALVDALVAKINLDGNAFGVALKVSTTQLQITQNASEVANGELTWTNNSGATVVAGTPYVAPAGTPEEVDAVKPGASVAAGQYTKHSIVWNKLVNNNAVSGLKVYREVETRIYSEEGAVDFAAYETAMDNALDVSAAAAVADLIPYLAR